MKKFTLIALLLCISFGYSYSQDIYTYVAASTAGVPSFVDPNIATASNLTAIGTGTSTPCAQGFSGITGFTSPTYSPAGACIQISLTAAAGYTINATGFNVHLRNSVTGPTKARLAYSADGGVTWIDDGIDYVPFSGSCATSVSGTNLASWTPFSVTNTTLLFRIYPFAAPGGGGTVQIFDLDIMGNVHVVCTTPTITASPATSGRCSGAIGVLLTASGAGTGGTYTWMPSTGLSATTGATVTATPGASTVYTVTGVTSAGCSSTSSATVSVNPTPSATISIAGVTTFCPGDSAVLTAGAGSGYSFQWYSGTTTITGATNRSYTALATGSYKVTVTNSFGCTATAIPATISVSPLPAAVITAAGATSFCSGRSVVLNASSGGYSYQWYFGSTAVPGATTSSYTDTATGNVKVKITSTFGCSNTSALISVTAVPLPFLVTGGTTTFCAGGSVLLNVNTGGTTSGIAYQWQRGGASISGATNSAYTGNVTGDYKCIVNIGGSCIDTTTLAHVVVHPAPAPIVSFNGTVLSTSFHYSTYQWYVNSIRIPGAVTYSTSPVISLPNGSYKVSVTDSNGCVGESAAFVIGGHSGLAVGSVSAADINIYPNPATNVVHIESPIGVRVVITAIDGRMVKDEASASDVNISTLANGLYILMLYNDNGEMVKAERLVKQ